MSSHDAEGPGSAEDGLFGIASSWESSALVVLPLPWEVSVSFRTGTARGPQAIRAASPQLDLYDPDFPEAWKEGIFSLEESEHFTVLNRKLRPRVAEHLRLLEQGYPGNPALTAEVNEATESLRSWVFEQTDRIFEAGKIPAILGGDHSVPLGAYQSAIQRHPDLGIMQIDAHADLRIAYEGFEHSHASIMHNALESGLKQLVQIGIRDFSPAEAERLRNDKRILALPDATIKGKQFEGRNWNQVCREIVGALPEKVWISLDIDGLDPSLAPNTGTPVPGGLSFAEASHLFGEVVRSGRTLIGFDLCEVAPDNRLNSRQLETSWDANVGSRILFRLASLAIGSQQS